MELSFWDVVLPVFRFMLLFAWIGMLAHEIGKLAALRDRGTISAEEFERAEATVLGTGPAPHRVAGAERAVPATT